jgi:outer membrane protein
MKKSLFLLACALLMPGGFSAQRAQAEQLPLWEVGAGFAGIDFPVYRGSSERRAYLLPFPYFTYHGEHLQVTRERVRGLLLRRNDVEMDISVNGSVPAKSSDTLGRHGMPDLDATLEIGPSLNVHMLYSEDKKTNFDLRLPVRRVFASNFYHVQAVGWVFQPQLDLDFIDVRHSGWNMGFVAGPIFADSYYHQYFYSVAPQYATPTRPAYTATGGYSGKQFIWALNKRYPDFWTGGFMKWDDLNGAVFANSPVVTSKQYFTVGWAVSWILDRSDKKVEVSND